MKTSDIPGAGLGLFLIESVKKGERIAVYSGQELDSDQVSMSNSEYIVQISKNVFLDSKGTEELGNGKFINCGRKSRRKINSRFASGTTYNYNKQFKMKWISIFAECDIKASVSQPVEILVDYGTEYWKYRDDNPSGRVISPGSHNIQVVQLSPTVYKL